MAREWCVDQAGDEGVYCDLEMASAGREVSSPATARLRQALCQRLDGMKIRNGFFFKEAD
jgi:hypothetical protein